MKRTTLYRALFLSAVIMSVTTFANKAMAHGHGGGGIYFSGGIVGVPHYYPYPPYYPAYPYYAYAPPAYAYAPPPAYPVYGAPVVAAPVAPVVGGIGIRIR